MKPFPTTNRAAVLCKRFAPDYRRPVPRTSGFTLVELLVVIGIIVILAAVSFAAANSALRSAWRAQCLSNMRQIGIAVTNYGNDNNLDYPLTDNPAWDVPLNPYLGVESTTTANPILKCPADQRPLTGTSGNFARSYSFNGNLPAKSSQVASANPAVMLAEWYSGGTTGAGGAGSNFQYYDRFDAVIYSPGNVPGAAANQGYHGQTSNFVFTDGHAESVNPNQTVSTPNLWQAGP